MMAAKKLAKSIFTPAAENVFASVQIKPKQVSSMNLMTPSDSPKSFDHPQISSYSTKSYNFHHTRSYSAYESAGLLYKALVDIYDLISVNYGPEFMNFVLGNLTLFANAEKMLKDLEMHVTGLLKKVIKEKFDNLTEEYARKLFDLPLFQ